MSPRPRVYVEDCHEPPMAAGGQVPEMVLAAGGEPFNRRLGQPSEKVSWEEILEFNPEVVVYAIRGLGTRFDPAEFYKTEGFGILEAGKSRRIYSVDDTLFNRPGPPAAEGINLLRKLFGPGVEAGPLVRLIQ